MPLPKRRTRRPRRQGYDVLVAARGGGPVQRWAVPQWLLTAAAALLAANVFFIVGLLSLSGARGMELALHKAQLQSLAQRHQALLEAAAEQEAQLVALALEAERLAQRVQELESLGEEIWRLLGYEGPPGGVSTADLGRGGPDDAFDGDVVSAALATVHTLARELPARFQELETLRETVLAYNHRMAHTPSIWPASGRVSSEYGMRRHPISGQLQLHQGIDIAAPTGTPVHATAAGRVVFAGSRGGYGLTVVIDHGYGLQTLYAHNSRLYVAEGDVVERGDVIAAVGSTGLSTGPHVHYEVHRNGEAVNPRAYLPTRNP